MRLTFRIRRYNPERDARSYLQDSAVDLEPDQRVLDGLNAIKWHQDGTLTYRRSCGHGVCGSDTMRINGRNRLACKVPVSTLKSTTVLIEPMLGYPVIKDLAVDLDPFFAAWRSVQPYLQPAMPEPERERLQSPDERARYDDTTKCILCAACTTACPPFWSNPAFVGPAAIVNAHRFIFDSRDDAAEERLELLNGREGVWRCRTVFNCTEACPRGIQVTEAIEEVKRTLAVRRITGRTAA